MAYDPFIGRTVDQDILNDNETASDMDHTIPTITLTVATRIEPPTATHLDPPIPPQSSPSFFTDVPSHKYQHYEVMPSHVSWIDEDITRPYVPPSETNWESSPTYMFLGLTFQLKPTYPASPSTDQHIMSCYD